MLGLKTQESSKFIRFFTIVQSAAEAKSSVFFLDVGDGKELFTENLECEDLSGWLIPKERATDFERLWRRSDETEEWDDFYCTSVWKISEDGKNINISFQ